jgi:hypothetical protein
MKKPLEKENTGSAHYAIKVFGHPAQDPAGSLQDSKAEPAGARIAQLIAYVDQINQGQADGYWSVLREL